MQDSSSPKVLRVKNTFFDYEDDADVVPPIVNTRRRTCPDLKDRQQAEDPAQDDEEPETPRCRPASEKPVLLGSPGQAARDAAPVLPEEAAGSKRVFTKNTFIHTEEEELKTPCNRRYHTCPEPDDGNDHVSDDEDAASSSDEKPEVSRAAQSSRRVSFNALPRVEDPLDSESEGPTPRPGNRSMYKTEDLQECLFAGKFGDYVQDGAIPTSSGYDVGARRNTEELIGPLPHRCCLTSRIIPALRPVLLPRFPVPVLIFRCASTRRRVLQVCLCPWPTQPLCLTQQATPRWPACLFRFRRLLWRCRLRTRRTLRTQECTTVGLPCRPRPARGPWLLPPAPRA
mmetsp:Transcript_137373/g.438367  ORF Transcript_137373/g.438367 Transcript_137373/m.438367 type:complete len:342 (+) Transcript_137373:55-1080(+)